MSLPRLGDAAPAPPASAPPRSLSVSGPQPSGDSGHSDCSSDPWGPAYLDQDPLGRSRAPRLRNLQPLHLSRWSALLLQPITRWRPPLRWLPPLRSPSFRSRWPWIAFCLRCKAFRAFGRVSCSCWPGTWHLALDFPGRGVVSCWFPERPWTWLSTTRSKSEPFGLRRLRWPLLRSRSPHFVQWKWMSRCSALSTGRMTSRP